MFPCLANSRTFRVRCSASPSSSCSVSFRQACVIST